MPMMNDDGATRGAMMAGRMMDEEGGEGEASSVFLSKAALGGRQCKPGEILTLKVTDIDPETGDVEAELQGYGNKAPESETYEEAFDRAVPEESE